MEELSLGLHEFVGREAELSQLKQSLAGAIAGRGAAVFISGEAGIGKTRLTDTFRDAVASENVSLFSGAADANSARPFLVLSRALDRVIEGPLFEEQEHTGFLKMFAINPAGMLVAQASSGEEDIDADIFAGMLSAVQNFVGDSFDSSGEQKGGLGRLEYGDMKILIEHGQHLFLTGVFAGGEHPDMKSSLRRTLQNIEKEHGALLGRWSGKVSEVEPVRGEIARLTETRFLVRKDLEGVKLESERIRIADEVLGALRHSSAEKPLVLLLEDLQWADESSLFVINYLARNIRKHPILIMGTLRPMESEALQGTIDRMRGEEILEEVRLENLGVGDTVSLINRAYAPNDFPGTLAERLYEQSRGNPLFVVEMLRGMHDDGSIALQDGRYTLVSETYQIPATVEEVVNRRLDSLDPDSMAMVEYASCIGQRFGASLAMSNRMMKSPDASLEKLLASGILLRRNGDLEFSHAVFQSVVYNGIGERWKAGHHRSLGEFLESAHANRLDEVMYDLARHFSRTKEHKKCVDYCVKAGEMAENSFAVEQALGFYNTALAAVPGLGPDAGDSGLGIRERVGDILALMGDYDGAIESYTAAEALADQGDSRARMVRKVGDTYEKKGEYDRALETLARAKESVGEGSAEYGRICQSESVVHEKKGDYDRGLELANTALKNYEASGAGKRDIGGILRDIGNIHASKGDFNTALQYYERSLPIMEEIGEQYGCAAALNNIGTLYNIKGDLANELLYYQRSLEILEKMGFKLAIATLLNNIGNVNYVRGDLPRALEHYERSLEIREAIGDQQGIAMSLTNIGYVQHDSGNLASALEFYERGLDMCLKIGDKYTSIHTLGGMADTQIGLGNVQMALESAERAIGTAAEIGARSEEGMGHRALGKAHRKAGDLAKAEEEFGKAKAIFEATEEKIELAVLSYEYAHLFGERAEPAKARECLEGALAEFEKMGMKLWVTKCREALGRL